MRSRLVGEYMNLWRRNQPRKWKQKRITEQVANEHWRGGEGGEAEVQKESQRVNADVKFGDTL